MPATKTLTDTMGWASYFIGNRGGFFTSNEPGLTSANLVAQVIMQPPFKWRWNRATVSFLLADPAGWKQSIAVTLGYRILDANGNQQTVTTAGTTGFVVPTWNRNIGGTTSDGSVVWTTSNVNDYVQAMTDFGFIEKAYLVDPATNLVAAELAQVQTEMTLDSKTGRPGNVCPFTESLAGAMTFRIMPGVPEKLYRMDVIYQKKPTLYAATSNPWNMPDEMMVVYDWGFLAFMYMFADSAKFQAANAKFISGLLGFSEGLSEQQISVFLMQYDFVMQNALRGQAKTQQGITGRGV